MNLGFITYFVDIEQLTVANVHHFQYPPCGCTPSHCRSDGQAHSPGLRSPPATFSAMSSKERIRSSMS